MPKKSFSYLFILKWFWFYFRLHWAEAMFSMEQELCGSEVLNMTAQIKHLKNILASSLAFGILQTT